MSLRSSHGGSVTLHNSGITVVPNERWSGNWRVREAEVTQSSSGGCTLFMPVCQDNEWEIDMPRDDTAYPEFVGLGAGQIVDAMYFKLGADIAGPSVSKGDKLANSMVVEVNNVVDNKGDVVRVVLRGKGGLLTPSTTIPTS